MDFEEKIEGLWTGYKKYVAGKDPKLTFTYLLCGFLNMRLQCIISTSPLHGQFSGRIMKNESLLDTWQLKPLGAGVKMAIF